MFSNLTTEILSNEDNKDKVVTDNSATAEEITEIVDIAIARALTQQTLIEAEIHEEGEKILNNTTLLIRLAELEEQIWEIPLNLIIPNPGQPREYFDPKKMSRLKATIKSQGQKNPIHVVPVCNPITKKGIRLFLVDGERRYRTMKTLNRESIKGRIIWAKDEREIFRASLIFNLSTEKNNRIEEAKAFEKMIGWDMEDGKTKAQAVKGLAGDIGYKPTRIKNLLRLLKLSPEIQQLIITNDLPTQGALQIASAKRKFGDKLDEVKIARILMDNPDKDFRATRGENVGKFTRDATRAAIRSALLEEGVLSEKEKREYEAAARVVGFVAGTSDLRRKIRAIIDPDLRVELIGVIRNRRGMPPELLHERIGELLKELKIAYQNVIKEAMEPEPLKIPRGAPKFTEQIGRRNSLFADNKLQYKIAVEMARASDDKGRLLTARDLYEKLKKEFGNITSTTVSNVVRQMDAIIKKCGLTLEVHQKRIRRQEETDLTLVKGYRLAWPNKK